MRLALLAAVERLPGSTCDALAAAAGMGYQGAAKPIRELLDAGYVERLPKPPRDKRSGGDKGYPYIRTAKPAGPLPPVPVYRAGPLVAPWTREPGALDVVVRR